MIVNNINQKIAEALKAHDELRLSTLRMLSSAFNYEKIAKQHELSEDEELAVVKKEAKKRTDALDALNAAKGKKTSASPDEIEERIKKEQQELAILKEYLPGQMSEEELQKLVDETISQTGAIGIKDMGRVIGAVKQKVGMRADGSMIAGMVKNKLVG